MDDLSALILLALALALIAVGLGLHLMMLRRRHEAAKRTLNRVAAERDALRFEQAMGMMRVVK